MLLKIPLKVRIFDSLVVSGFFLSLIPIRLLFMEYIGDNWLGSFGVMTAFATMILYFTYKGKLGWFGRSIQRFFQKRHKKKRILFVIQMSFATFILVMFIHGVNYADTNDKFDFDKREILALLPNAGLDTTEKLTNKGIEELMDKPEMILIAMVVFAHMMIFDFDKYALAVWIINDITGGIYMTLATIFLVEEIEVIGLFVFFNFYGKKLTPNKAET